MPALSALDVSLKALGKTVCYPVLFTRYGYINLICLCKKKSLADFTVSYFPVVFLLNIRIITKLLFLLYGFALLTLLKCRFLRHKDSLLILQVLLMNFLVLSSIPVTLDGNNKIYISTCQKATPEYDATTSIKKAFSHFLPFFATAW